MPTVLVVDDEEIQRLTTSHVLQRAGCQVHLASDGEEGLEMLRKIKPEVVVCDVVMPRLNGYQFVATVRKDPQISATPIILLTSMAGRAQVRLGMTSGADDYLFKPFQPTELLDAIRGVLERREAHNEGLLRTLHTDFASALDAQRQALAAKYEVQLLRELNSRWSTDSQGDTQKELKGATLLVADLFGATPLEAGAELASRAYQAARDSLYLFGAAQVLPYGGEVLAVFESRSEDQTANAAARALRAAFALQAAANTSLGKAAAASLSIAVHVGDVSFIRLDDALHNDSGYAPLPGQDLKFAVALRRYGAQMGWNIAASASAMKALPPDAARAGRGAVLGGVNVCEMEPG